MRGVILAGGESRRFGGTPKGLALVGGRRIVDRLVEEFRAALGSAPLLIANHPEARHWVSEVEVIADTQPGVGVLGGLWTAVIKAPAPVVVVAWDLPFINRRLIERLAAGLGAADCCLPWSQGWRGFEPLAASYGPGAGPAIERAILRGQRSAVSFHAEVRVTWLPEAAVRECGDPARMFWNVNTAQDLTQAEELL